MTQSITKPTTAQSLGALLKSARDMSKDKGLCSDTVFGEFSAVNSKEVGR